MINKVKANLQRAVLEYYNLLVVAAVAFVVTVIMQYVSIALFW